MSPSLVLRALPRALFPALPLSLPRITPISPFIHHLTNPLPSQTFRPAHFRFNSTSSPTLPSFSLQNQVILVTGGARGLGLAQTRALLSSGATVYALDLLPSPSSAFEELQASPPPNTKLHYRTLDVRDAPTLNDTVSAIARSEGRIDGLIAAAGIQQETPALEYSAEDSDRMLGVNVTGVFMTAQAVARAIIDVDADKYPPPPSSSSARPPKSTRGGSIVLIASMSGTVVNRNLHCPAYNASKAAVIQLTRNLAAEWGVPHGIRVNSLSPGYVTTEMTEALFKRTPERRGEWAGQNMLGRLGKVDDFGGAVCFLLSEASGFMTGADLRVDGGHAAW